MAQDPANERLDSSNSGGCSLGLASRDFTRHFPGTLLPSSEQRVLLSNVNWNFHFRRSNVFHGLLLDRDISMKLW